MAEVEIREDNTQEFLRELDDKIEAALVAVGIQASNYAADRSPVDTGLLRNSMTYALAGEKAAVATYSADRGGGSGRYIGTIGSKEEQAVYVGTNVEYAIYQELGTRRMAGHHMIKNAAANHQDEYKRLVETILKG